MTVRNHVTPTSSLRFDLIDPLRGFAAVTIFVYHSIAHLEWKAFPVHFPFTWFHWGWMAVDIFFVLSGFVITLSAIKLYAKTNGARFRIAFLKRRARRIVPLYLLTLLVFIAVMLLKGQYRLDWQDIGIHLAFLHPFFSNSFGSINGVNWSVGVEMHFYIFFAICFPFLKKRYLVWVLALCLASAWLWRFTAWQLAEPGAADRVTRLFMSSVQLPGMLDEFCFGMIAAFFAHSHLLARLQKSLLARWIILGLFLALAYAICAIYMQHGTYWNNPYMVIFFRSALAADFSLLIIFFCSFQLTARAKKIITPLVYLGTISYGIYLFHLPVLLVIKDLPWNVLTKFLAALGVALALASISWHFYEKKFLK